MTREDNPKYFAHVCEVIKAVFMAEGAAYEKHHIAERFKAGTISSNEYIEAIAEEMISYIDKSKIEDYGKE